ncbi:uncharacterized protein LOC128739837 [Sabethes cyaneus]|uniref:uncharacterized protein LOC128739837 n=1 Tax=Sabethes cyaneus TaxID=53552 RepID=UPI00237E6D97|nr:uncharacterized protein LOC128739837 [Sabethes cyaneus]
MAKNGDDLQVQYNCVLCDNSDEHDDMVACDSCQMWHHYSCVNVSASVRDREWYCPTCEPLYTDGINVVEQNKNNPSRSNPILSDGAVLDVPKKTAAKSSAGTKNTRKSRKVIVESITSSARARLELELNVVDEQRRLREEELAEEKKMKDRQRKLEEELREQELAVEARRIAEAKRALEQNMADEREYRKQQMAIRKQSADEKAKLIRQASEYSSSHGSRVNVGVGVTDPGEKVKDWLEQTNQQTEGTKKTSTSAVRPSSCQKQVLPDKFNTNKNPPARKINEALAISPPNCTVPQQKVQCKSLVSQGIQKLPLQPNNPKKQINLNCRELSKQISSSGVHSSDKEHGAACEVQQPVAENKNDQDQRSQHHSNDIAEGPTSRQLATRQVMGKDLPIFSGNPEEWPIWISNFQRSTTTCGFSDDENLIRLQRCLKGPALEAVRSRLLCPAGVPHVIKALQMRYGRPETLIRSMTERVRQMPPLKANDLESIIEFGLAVDNLVQHLENVGYQAHLSNPSLLHDLVGKLPVDYRLNWSAVKSEEPNADLAAFGRFMSSLVELAYNVADDLPSLKPQKTKHRERSFVQTHAEPEFTPRREPVTNTLSGRRAPKRPCAVCKAEGHRVSECGNFKTMNIDGRLKAVREFGLCRSCLNCHGKWPCKTAKECGINDCRLKHNPLLHSSSATVQAAVSTSHLSQLKTVGGPLFRIIPVTLYGKNTKVDIYAFVDEGSQITLLEDSVADQLGLAGTLEPLNLQWTGNIKRSEPKSRRISTEISGTGCTKQYRLGNARTVGGLLLPSQSMDYDEMTRRYPHLRGLPIPSYTKISPKLLIGLDNLKLTVPLKIREGRWEEPIATKSRIGWSIYGCATESQSKYVCGFHVGGWTDPEQELNQLVRDYITLDDTGITYPSTPLESEEEKRARIIMESTTRRVDGRYETGMLWKRDKLKFPESFGMAYKRMCSLEKRLSKDPVLYDRVRQQIRDYEAKGYAHKATESELSTTDKHQCWYLPLGIVLNPKKPNKLRLIWDAAATVDGVSLNSALLKGPDLLKGLPSVISNFRLYRFALTGDIKEMFHRFFIRIQDRQFLRFLFRDRPDQKPVTYVMDVAIFGASCSPSSAQYIKNINAKEFEADFPRAVTAIVQHHYVDDYLDSFGTAEEAVRIGKEVKKIHAQGGFEIRNFLSNDPHIAAQVGEESTAVEKDIRTEKDERIESVLGMKWIPTSDTFVYTVSLRDNLKHVLEESYLPTKREILRTVMSFFDPMGLISFFLIHGRILMQDIWAAGIGWDDQINEKLMPRWRSWINLVPKLNSLRIPRCYFVNAVEKTYSSLQVHVFVDASRSAYACAVYFRVETLRGPDVRLVAAKSKVAPLKMQTVPRLELRAAVLGSRLLNSVISMHALPVTKRVLWSDSNTVLAWIKSDQRRYHQYVGFRVGEILTVTDVSEWRKIGSAMNVADDATKWGSGPNISSESRWFRGPEFLKQPEELWPGKNAPIAPTEEELIVCNLHHNISDPLIDADRFSRWERLHRTMAYVHRFMHNVRVSQRKGKPIHGCLTQNELVMAELSLWKQAQKEVFASEMTILEATSGEPDDRHATLPKGSAIYKLWPFMDKDGLIRKRNRLSNAAWIPYQTKYPVILPRKHRITFLLVDYFHRRFRHCNRETVVNQMRQHYEIAKLRSLITKVAESCVWCRVHRACPYSPPMAPLPKVRLTPYVRPFTYVGVDYFGPVLVKVGRSNVKRWIALFTCLTIRAVHLEVVHSLSKESCVMAIRRFVSRRGAPAEIFSDNGTNFHGANNQLKREIENRNDYLASTFTNTTTRWSFIPPGAPHMGGAWERMVRSMKTAIGTILDAQRRPDDEVLETVIIEAEAMVNTRPLTYIPIESADQEALTPNHFIFGCSDGVKQVPVLPTDYRTTLNSGWKLAKHLSDGIWKRWIQEYLPVISRRSKWFEDVKEIAEGSLVLIVDGAVRNQWTRGRVVKVIHGKDGRVRQAWVKTTNGVIRRPVVKLALLDVLEVGKPEVEQLNGLQAGECDVEYPSATSMR